MTYNTRKVRLILGLIVLLLLIVGTIQNPAKVIATLVAVPTAFAASFIWVLTTLLMVWFGTDLFCKYLLGKSLREHIVDKDPRFEQNLVIALVIVMALAMLIAK